MKITDKEEENIIKWFDQSFFIESDKVDLLHEIDRNITVEENKTILKERYNDYFKGNTKEYFEKLKNGKEKEEISQKNNNPSLEDEGKLFTEANNFLIIGKKGSAKTSLGFVTAKKINDLTGKKMYMFRFPKPELLITLPFKVRNITTMKQLYNITDAVCLIDEAHRYFDVLNKSVNQDLKELLAASRQNNVSFIFITHNSYFITRGLFTYIDVRIIKEVNEGHWATDRPHMSALYSSTMVYGKENFFIDSDYKRGSESFEKPSWFTEELSNAYRNDRIEKQDFFNKFKKMQ